MVPLIILYSMLRIQTMQFVAPQSEYISYMGRFSKVNSKEYVCSYPASTIKIRTNAQSVIILLQDYPLDIHNNYIAVAVDGVVIKEFPLHKDSLEYTVFTSTDNIMHTVEVCKRTEGLCGNMGFKGFKISEGAKLEKIDDISKKIIFIGNSITCGYGNEASSPTETYTAATENAYMSYAAIAARHVKAQYHLIAFSGKGVYRNWGDTVFDKETMPQIFMRTLVHDSTQLWKHSDFKPKLIVINLGTNDFSPPLQAQEDLFVSRYTAFLKKIQELYPQTPIICVNSQMLNEPFRSNQIDWIQKSIVKSGFSNIYFCKLSMQGADGYGADYHPNIAQNYKNAKELVDCIQELGLIK